jgi:hypothetical protein
MRDRLIEILSKPIYPKEGVNLAEVIADYLLDNGVIVQTPGEDVVEVVRCKDCKYFEKDDEFDMTGFCTCERITKNYGGEIYPYEDDFCSYGKRKEQP